jgi:hypothetical protein
MSWYPVGFAARSNISARLQDPDYGLNAQLDQACSSYALDPDDYHVDFTSVNSFIQGDVEPGDVLAPEDISYPLVVLFAGLTAPGGDGDMGSARTFGSMFSGYVHCVIRYYMTWGDENALMDFETPCEAVQEAFFRCFNTTKPPGLWVLTMPAGATGNLSYDFLLSCRLGPVLEDGENFRRMLEFSLKIAVDVWTA